VAHEVHESDDIDPIAQALEGEGTAEIMQTWLGNAGEIRTAADNLPETSSGEAGMGLIFEKWGIGRRILAIAQITDELTAGFGTQINRSFFITFAVTDLNGASAQVDIGEIEGDELLLTQTGIDENGEDGSITLTKLSFGIASGKHDTHMLNGYAWQGFFGDFRWGHFANGVFVGRVINLVGPPIKKGFDGTKGGVDATGITVKPQLNEIFPDELRGEVFEVGGTGLEGESIEIAQLVFVELEGARGEFTSLAIDEEGDYFIRNQVVGYWTHKFVIMRGM